MARGGAASVNPRRAPIPDMASGERRLEGATAHYLSNVLRLRAGDVFTAFDPATAREADGTVITVERGTVTVGLRSTREGATRAPRPVTWVQGLAKGDKCDAVVRDATELGATRIVLSATRRSVPRLDATRALARRVRWAKIAEQAARQCGRSDAPIVLASPRWEDAIDACADAETRFCLWDGAEEPLAPALLDALARGSSLAFACGAEGGLDDGEVQAAITRGWIPVSLGSLVLRTETVAAAVLGAVLVWAEAFGYVAPGRKMLK
jgi:16S rRNA (uracil1498-N3)-methyltransferase